MRGLVAAWKEAYGGSTALEVRLRTQGITRDQPLLAASEITRVRRGVFQGWTSKASTTT